MADDGLYAVVVAVIIGVIILGGALIFANHHGDIRRQEIRLARIEACSKSDNPTVCILAIEQRPQR